MLIWSLVYSLDIVIWIKRINREQSKAKTSTELRKISYWCSGLSVRLWTGGLPVQFSLPLCREPLTICQMSLPELPPPFPSLQACHVKCEKIATKWIAWKHCEALVKMSEVLKTILNLFLLHNPVLVYRSAGVLSWQLPFPRITVSFCCLTKAVLGFAERFGQRKS